MNHLLQNQPTSGTIVRIAAVFGIVTGLVEGAAFLTLQKLGWLNWHTALKGASAEIIWIAALFDVVLFGALGLVMATLARFVPRLPIGRLSVFVLGFLMFFDWLRVSGRIAFAAIVVLAVGLALQLARWVGAHERAAMRFGARSFPWIAGTALLALVGIQTGLWLQERRATALLPAPHAGAPNVLVIVVDTLRADRLSSYGHRRATSPNLDHIAEQGVLFENAIATSSWTPPSHASLLTGRAPHEHRVEWDRPLDRRYPTLGEVLEARGYRSGAFSANETWFSRRWGFGRGFIRFDDYPISVMFTRTVYGRVLGHFKLGLGRIGVDARKRAAGINRSALNWIDEGRDRPFFAFLNYVDTHAPYVAPEPYRSRFSTIREPGGKLIDYGMGSLKLTPDELQAEVDAYDGAIAYVDAHIGALFESLEQRGLTANTLVIITSDHGESFGEHGLFFHRNGLYREVIHVPLIVWWPGHVPAGVRASEPVTNAALPATIMDLLGAHQRPFPGPSLARLWRTPQVAPAPAPSAEIAQQPFEPLKRLPVYHSGITSLLSPQWHYIETGTAHRELYDWRNDPQELRNLAGQADMESVITQLRSQLPPPRP